MRARHFRVKDPIPAVRDGRVTTLPRGLCKIVGRTTFRGWAAHRVRGSDGATYLVMQSHWAEVRSLGCVVPLVAKEA